MPVKMRGRIHRPVAQWTVAGDEIERRVAELVAQLVEPLGERGQPGIGHEAGDAPEEGERRVLHQRVRAGFDEGEGGQGLARHEPLVAELDEPFADLRGIEAEVFGIEPLAPAPVTDAGGTEDAPPAHGFEQGQMEIAELLIDKKVTKFDPSKFEDTYEDALIAMIDAKRKGEKPPKAAPKPKKNVVDLASVLRKSLAKEGIKRPTAKPTRKSA